MFWFDSCSKSLQILVKRCMAALPQVDDVKAEMAVALERARAENIEQRRASRKKEEELTARCARMSQQIMELKVIIALGRKRKS